ncbi:12615_t:CDS:2 [Racocetra fulgida]|uniref:12615_t:CDS:1 n=1 Tax=Racocetra fulgida TaxID=60492 RepID=A0A9N9GDV2_9GLOM|nr:12615_t:CDS:2 [Racocetra fulgida]
MSSDELNKLQAKALRAKIMNLPNASELEKQYENARLAAENSSSGVESETRVEVLPLLDSRGRPYDLGGSASKFSQHAGPSRRKKEKVYNKYMDENADNIAKISQKSAEQKRYFAIEGVIFMETVVNLKYQNHTVIECIPMPWDLAQDAPAYFKEGIMESGGEWSQNKKLVDTSKTGFRRSMVKELPYFHVWFGLDKGFGHVIEKEKSFPRWFGKEIVAGVCDLPPDVWRRPKKQNPRDNSTRVSEFMKKWKKWDWTTILEGK